MADIADKDELELHDLGFTLRKRSGKWEIVDLQDRVVEILQQPESLHGWLANYRMGVSQTGKKLWVTSGYGMGSKEPFVNLTMPGGAVVQMSPTEARAVALNLLSCAEAAYADAFIVEWSQSKLNLGLDKAAYLLSDFREFMVKRDK